MPRENIHIIYLSIAKKISELSYCTRAKVGCIIVKDNNIISMGYNGTPSGFPDNVGEYLDEHNNLKSSNIILHAETNAILKCAKNGISSNNADIYLTMSPCFECSKIIIQAGIKRVYFLEKYRDDSGLDFLKSNNIEVIQISI